MPPYERVLIAERLKQQAPEILRQWEAKARASVPAARHESRLTLRNSIPEFLDELASALALSGRDEPAPAPKAPTHHAKQRADLPAYTLEQVVKEYSLLRGTIIDVLSEAAPIELDDLRLILDTIDMGTAEASGHFVELQERALRESEERFRLLVAGVKDYAVFMIDREGTVITWNQGAERIKGYSASEIVGKNFSVFYTEADVRDGKPLRGLKTAAQEGRYEDVGLRVRKDGSTFCANVLITPLSDEKGELRGFAKVTRDVTERVAMEDELRKWALEMAEASRRKDEFLAMLAHELRNPLASVVTSAEILRLHPQSDPVIEQARAVIARQGKHLARLVDDLLDVARITQNKIILHKMPVELRVLVGQVAETLRPFIAERQQRLTIALPDSPVWVEADFVRLSQVLSNVIHNAAKFTYRNGDIKVNLKSEEGQAIVEIRDTGSGIDPALLPRVFEIFTQGNHPHQDGKGGLGIGLTLSRRLVEMHGGSISIDSPGLDMGSIVTVRLPALDGNATEAIGATTSVASQQVHSVKDVLIVDDSIDAASSLATLLGFSGFSVRTAHTGQDALTAIEAACPDAVVLDIGLPDIDGYEVARRIRATKDCNRVQLIALSGYGLEQDKQESKLAGFDFHLTKPTDLATLQHALTQPVRSGD